MLWGAAISEANYQLHTTDAIHPCAYGDSTASFQKFNLEKPIPWEIWTLKGHFEVRILNGSGIWDPQIEILQIVIMRTDRSVET